MTPETRHGRVAIFEDDEKYLELLHVLVAFCQHEVVLVGTGLEQSLRAIEARAKRLGHVGIDAALIDGNLDGGDSNRDGRTIIETIRNQPGGNDVYIVSVSSTQKLVEGADDYRPKADSFGAVRLVDESIKQRLSSI